MRVDYNILEASRASGVQIVAIGGGSGLASMLRGLKRCTENITAVVTMADDGGGSGVLRQDLGILPPGDIRNCILALANTEPTMEKLLNYRFPEGAYAGQSFGNLFLAALNGISGSFDAAVSRMGEFLAITGRVLPVTRDNVFLEALFDNGSSVLGESKIFAAKKEQNCRIRRVRLVPEHARPHPEVLEALESADLIVLGPGSLYTSVIPNLLVDGIADAIGRSGALRVYVCNIMTQEGETEGYTAFDHVAALRAHGGVIDICIANGTPIPDEVLAEYAFEGAEATVLDGARFDEAGIAVKTYPLTDIQAGKVRHHPAKLAFAILQTWRRLRPRSGHVGEMDQGLLDWLAEILRVPSP